MILSICTRIGHITLNFIAFIGHLSLFISSSIIAIIRPPFYPSLIIQQMMRIGYYSLPIVSLTAFFTGGVLALQIYHGGNEFNSENIVATIVALGVTRELGPVLCGLMVSGRISSAIAAEIGTMRVTEQIDALTTLSSDPFQYLIAPRIIATVICLPLLTILADIIGIMGGFIASVQALDFNGVNYLQTTINFVSSQDLISGAIKATVFGLIISIMGCYYGYYSAGGAQGVGRATTNAVVVSSILILSTNYLMTSLVFAS